MLIRVYTPDYFSRSRYAEKGNYRSGDKASFSAVSKQATMASISVFLQHGEFDDQLQFPFNGEITVERYDRSKNQWSKEAVIKLENEVHKVVIRYSPIQRHSGENEGRKNATRPTPISESYCECHPNGSNMDTGHATWCTVSMRATSCTVSMRVVAVKLA